MNFFRLLSTVITVERLEGSFEDVVDLLGGEESEGLCFDDAANLGRHLGEGTAVALFKFSSRFQSSAFCGICMSAFNHRDVGEKFI